MGGEDTSSVKLEVLFVIQCDTCGWVFAIIAVAIIFIDRP